MIVFGWKLFVNLKFFGLVNLIYEKELVKELLQHDLTTLAKNEMLRLLSDTEYRNCIIKGYREIKALLGEEGASQRAADKMIELIGE